MTTEIINIDQYENELNVKFAELQTIANQKIGNMTEEEIKVYEPIIKENRTFNKIKIIAYNTIKTGKCGEKEFFNKNVRAYLLNFGFNPITPIENEEKIITTDKKGKEHIKINLHAINNMKDNWKSGDRDATILDILTSCQIPNGLRTALGDGELSKDEKKKYKEFFDASKQEAETEHKINNLTVDMHVTKLQKNLKLCDFKLTCIKERKQVLKMDTLKTDKKSHEDTLNKICGSSVRYQRLNAIAKKYCIQ